MIPPDLQEFLEQLERRIESRIDHKIELYKMQVETLAATSAKIDKIEADTAEIVAAFNAAKGAFTVLGWGAKVVKPLIWLGASIAFLSTFWAGIKNILKGIL